MRNIKSTISSNKGFTLIELLVVIAALALGAGGGMSVNITDPYNNATSQQLVHNYGGGSYSGPVVVLLSSGENGYGAYGGRGGSAPSNFDNANTKEKTNAINNLIYLSVPVDGFDDIGYFWTYGQLEYQTMQTSYLNYLATIQSMYMSDESSEAQIQDAD